MEVFTNVEPNCTVAGVSRHREPVSYMVSDKPALKAPYWPNTPVPDAAQLCVCKDEVEEEEEKRGTCLDQEQPEPPQIKEEDEELCSSQEVEHLLLKQEIKSEYHEPFLIKFEDLSEKHVCKEETEAERLIWKQERSSSLDEEDLPDLPQIKEEQEEICINENGKQFKVKQETDAFMVTEHDQEKVDSKPEPSEKPVLEENTQIRNSDAVTVQQYSPSRESSHSCDTCGKVYKRKANLKTHMRTHTGEMPFTCKICKRGFTRSMSLKKHFRTHKNGKPFSCEICQKVFIQAYSLTCHMRTHTGEKPFTCNICEKTFSLSSNLKVHQRSHTGERPYTCNVCEKRFIQTGALKAHMRIHTGEKPFPCTVCGNKFSYSATLKAHMRIHTSVKNVSRKIYPKPTVFIYGFAYPTSTHTG